MIHLSPRLMCAVPYVRPNILLADVGTDHAYLPIYLCQKRMLSPVTAANGERLAAIASDINKGPVERAEQHIKAERLVGAIKTVCTDGLNGLEVYDPKTIVVFGMGGELIVSILASAPWIRSEGTRLILQPMTRAGILRRYLTQNGFAITGESITFEDKYYQIIAARYCGENSGLSETELLLGKRNIEAREPHFAGFVRHEIQVLEKIRDGKRRSLSGDTSEESRMIEQLEEILK